MARNPQPQKGRANETQETHKALGAARGLLRRGPFAVAAGAQGLMTEIHDDPVHAFVDGAQALTPNQFAKLSQKVNGIRAVIEE